MCVSQTELLCYLHQIAIAHCIVIAVFNKIDIDINIDIIIKRHLSENLFTHIHKYINNTLILEL